LGGGVGSDFLLFFTDHQEEAVQGLANDVLVAVEAFGLYEGERWYVSGELDSVLDA